MAQGYKRKPKFRPTMCFACEHCSSRLADMKQGLKEVEEIPPSEREALGIKKKTRQRTRPLRRCTLHNIWVGESSATCSDGTNIESMTAPMKSTPTKKPISDAWADF